MLNRTFEYVLTQLEKAQIEPEIIEHDPVFTCDQADRVTPVPEAGLKSILLLTKKHKYYVLCVLAGHHRLDFKVVQDLVNEKCSMANPQKLEELLECDPGSVPPIVSIEGLIVLIDDDPKLQEQPVWYFNPGVNTKTFGVPSSNLLALLKQSGATQTRIRKP